MFFYVTLDWLFDRMVGSVKQEFTAEFWLREAALLLFRGRRAYQSAFGLMPETTARLWKYLEQVRADVKPKHLLWCLLMLKTYDVQDVLHTRCCKSRTTFAHWVWCVVDWLDKALPKVFATLCFLFIYSNQSSPYGE